MFPLEPDEGFGGLELLGAGGWAMPLMGTWLFWAWMGCEYGAAVIIIWGLWWGTTPGCCIPLAGVCDDGAGRLAGAAASAAPAGWFKLAEAGCSWGLRQMPWM